MTASSRRSSGPGGRPAATFAARGDGRAPDLSDVAQLIKDGTVQNVVIMVRARRTSDTDFLRLAQGSVLLRACTCAPGVCWTDRCSPDFRSPETGLYANLEKYQVRTPFCGTS